MFATTFKEAPVPVVEAIETSGRSLYPIPLAVSITSSTPPLCVLEFVTVSIVEEVEYPTFSGACTILKLYVLLPVVVIE